MHHAGARALSAQTQPVDFNCIFSIGTKAALRALKGGDVRPPTDLE
jgi:hypothetical protein